MTVFNQATHPIFSYRWPRATDSGGVAVEQPGTFIGGPNTELFRRGLDYEFVRRQLLFQLRRFFDLLHEP